MRKAKFFAIVIIACLFVGCHRFIDDRACAKDVIDALGEPDQVSVTSGVHDGLGYYLWNRQDGTYSLFMFKDDFGWYIDSLKRTQETERESRSEEITNVYIWSRNYRGNR